MDILPCASYNVHMSGVLRDGWQKQLKKVDRGLILAEVRTMNDLGLLAADLDRATIKKRFVNRTQWTVNAIWPKRNTKRGRIPETVRSTQGLYIRVGSVLEYMKDQESGWAAMDPHVPTNAARVGRNYRRKIKKAASMNHIKRDGVMTAANFKRAKTRKKKIDAMIGVARSRKNKFRGVYFVRPQDPTPLPPGYYKVERRRSLTLWRLLQPGSRKRKATHWHTDTMKNPILKVMEARYYDINATRILKSAGLRG